jgi:cellobiose phosphorylase
MTRTFATPRDAELGLATIANASGLTVSVLPNGSLFSIEYRDESSSILINQVLGQPIHGGIARVYLRIGGERPSIVQLVGAEARPRFGFGNRSMVWEGSADPIRHRATLELHETDPTWLWRIEVFSDTDQDMPCDVLMVQDLGLGERGFVMGNEAYASQYIDHQIVEHATHGPVVMSRQALAQGGRHPWLALGALEGAAAYSTDALQLMGPAYRETGVLDLPYGASLANERLQHEVACPALQSKTAMVSSRSSASFTFFAHFVPHHPEASGEADLDRLSPIAAMARRKPEAVIALRDMARSLLQDARPLGVLSLDEDTLARLGPRRTLEEHGDGGLMSFFVPDGTHNRHVVLRDKEHLVRRRHGAMLRSGQGMMLDDRTLCATHWMHGVFAAQLTIGNTSFHKLFSVSRDPYNLTRASGLRILVDLGEGWRLLAVPSAFDIGLGDCRWIYRLEDRIVTVRAIAAGEAAAMQWRISVEGPTCRFLVFGHVVLGEREFEDVGTIEVDPAGKRISLRPGPDSLWGRTYPDAVYHLVVDTPDAIEAIGGDELLYDDGLARGGPYVALRSSSTSALSFAVVGSMTDAAESLALAERFASGVDDEVMVEPARRYWSHVGRDAHLSGKGADVEAHDAFLPWLAHDAIIHLTAPHGLEQYTGAAWGTRDVCQGPVEFLLTMEHDKTVRDIMRVVFSEQYEERGDWPQWFMLAPYSQIRAGGSHGDVIIWPLKALCDYIEETGDFAFLDEVVPWRRDKDLATSAGGASIADHVDKLLASVRERFIPGTTLIRYGEGDWNDSLQPVDPDWPDCMVSSWTVALFYEQIERYAAILRRRGRASEADGLASLARAIREDVNRFLMRDGVIAGYGLFDRGGKDVELLLHPSDRRTGIEFSLIPMTQAILGSLFTPQQARDHLALIAKHLVFPDGVRLMNKPIAYCGGVEKLFRRAESAAFFGREIGLMYVHAHLRYCEALAMHADADAVWHALALVNPIAVTRHLTNATPRQRNAYFSSSDAAFRDRYQASDEWDRVMAGRIAVDGGWRIYSSGPGLFTNVLLRHIFGRRRRFGQRMEAPKLPASLAHVRLDMTIPD